MRVTRSLRSTAGRAALCDDLFLVDDDLLDKLSKSRPELLSVLDHRGYVRFCTGDGRACAKLHRLYPA
jgi:hypothetical protein